MDLLKAASTLFLSPDDGVTDATGKFDLELENFNFLLSYIPFLTLLLTSLAGDRKLLKGQTKFDEKKKYDYVIGKSKYCFCKEALAFG